MLWYPQVSESEMLAGAPPPQPYSLEHQFAQACGLRRSELLSLRVRDIRRDEDGHLWIRVSKGRRVNREVPILPEHEQLVLSFAGNSRLFPSLPVSVDVRYARQWYARCLYYQLRKEAPQPHGTGQIDVEAVRAVMQAIGHSDQEIVTRYYLGLREDMEGPVATENTELGLADQQQ